MNPSIVSMLVALCLAGCGSHAKPSLVGDWEMTWSGDTHGVETLSFKSDGTYSQKSDSKIDSSNFHFVDEHSGTYTFKDNVLTTTATGKLEALNPDGSVLRHSDLKSQTIVEKVTGLTEKEFTLVPDPGLKLDGPFVYKKK
jgi:hypothetical protein